MKKTKKTIKKSSHAKRDYQKEVGKLLKTKELITGFVMLFLIIGGLIYLNHPSAFKYIESIKTVTSSPQPTVKKGENKQISTPTKQPQQEIVRENDNFWKISERGCGTGKYYLVIQQYNNYEDRSLQVGDVIKIKCSFE